MKVINCNKIYYETPGKCTGINYKLSIVASLACTPHWYKREMASKMVFFNSTSADLPWRADSRWWSLKLEFDAVLSNSDRVLSSTWTTFLYLNVLHSFVYWEKVRLG